MVSKSGSTEADIEVVVTAAESPALVVRDVDALSSTKISSLSDDSKRVFDFTAYLTSMVTLLSLLTLMGFNFASSNPAFAPAESSILSPNQWELLPFIMYIQAMASVAQYVVRLSPQYLWDFVDTFSWTVLIPIHSDGSGISDLSQRRLSEGAVVVLDGIVAFADRIGVQETNLLQTTVGGLLVVVGALLIASGLVYWSVPPQTRDKERERLDLPAVEDDYTAEATEESAQVVHAHPPRRPAMLVVLSVVVMVGIFVLYPITMVVTFELVSQACASQVNGSSLAIALLVIAFVCIPFVVQAIRAVATIHNQDEYLSSPVFRTVWGSLASPHDIQFDRRVVFVSTWLSMQVVSAIVVGGVWSEVWQLVVLLCIDVAYLLFVVVGRPYKHHLALACMATVIMVKMLNTSLAFAFLSTSDTSASTRRSAATAFIVINAVLVTLWFARHFGMVCRLVRLMWDQLHDRHHGRHSSLYGASPSSVAAMDVGYNGLHSTKHAPL